MAADDLILWIFCLGLLAFVIYLPIRFLILLGQFKALEERVAKLARSMTPEATKEVEPSAQPAPAPVAPPPLPARPARPVETAQPDPLFVRLRELGLLPPADLKGEYALGAWWAVRLGGLLAVAAVVFLGIWLNLRSTIPPIVRLASLVTVGGFLFWGGLRLARTRHDLGQVVAATGLAVWQFAAWAAHGLPGMRVFVEPSASVSAQFAVAVVVAAIALRRDSQLFGQLAVIFAAVAAYLSLRAGVEPWSSSAAAWGVAVLGMVLLVRGRWGSAGVLGLVGSQACLLFLYDAIPSAGADYLPLQCAAAACFLVFWVAERLLPDDAAIFGRDARSAFQLAGFFAPALLALFLAQGGESGRASVAFLLAVVAVLAGVLERGRSPLVAEVLLLSSMLFVGAGCAWLADAHLVWLIWALASALTLPVAARTRSELVRWASEGFAGTAVFAYAAHSPVSSWLGLVAVGVFAALLSLREDWEHASAYQKLRRVLGVLGVAFATLVAQDRLSRADAGWAWVVVLAVALVRFRPAVLWAFIPGFLLTTCLVVFGSAVSHQWLAFWAGAVIAVNVGALWRLGGQEGGWHKTARYALAFVTAVVAFAFARHLAVLWFPQAVPTGRYPAWVPTFAWAAGSLLIALLTAALRRVSPPADLSLFALGAGVGSLLQSFETGYAEPIGLAQAPFVLAGLACLLYVLGANTRGQGAWGTVQRSAIASFALFIVTFPMLIRLPGAGVSLFWALAGMLTFVAGHLLGTRSLRMVGLLGLGVATFRVLSHDITDLLGRIAACGAVAIAFFGIAWLYGRIRAEER